MNATTWAAVSAIVVSLGALGTLVGFLMRDAYAKGVTANRLDALERGQVG